MSKPIWEPSRNPVHRLIQLLDVIVISDNRCRQLRGFPPLAGIRLHHQLDGVDSSESLRERAIGDDRWIIISTFPDDAVFAQTQVEQLACDAIAFFRSAGHPAPEQAVTATAQVLLDFVYLDFGAPEDPWVPLSGTTPSGPYDPNGDGPSPEDHYTLPERYQPARSQLLRCLAFCGQTVPFEIHDRARLGLYRLPPEWGREDAIDRLFGWVMDSKGETEVLDAIVRVAGRIANNVRAFRLFMSDEKTFRSSATWSADDPLLDPHQMLMWDGPMSPWYRRELNLLEERAAQLSILQNGTGRGMLHQIVRLCEHLRVPLQNRLHHGQEGAGWEEHQTWERECSEQTASLRERIDQLAAPLQSRLQEFDATHSHIPSENHIEATQNRQSSRGRKPTDPAFDKRVSEAWKTGRYPTYADLARELNCKERDVQLAIDRQRQKQRKTRP